VEKEGVVDASNSRKTIMGRKGLAGEAVEKGGNGGRQIVRVSRKNLM